MRFYEATKNTTNTSGEDKDHSTDEDSVLRKVVMGIYSS